jgi:hypothetical protein
MQNMFKLVNTDLMSMRSLRIAATSVVPALGIAACTPSAPTMDLEQAQAYCRAEVSKSVSTGVNLGVGIGSDGKVRPTGGITIGVNLDSALNPQGSYENCVRKNSGLDPIEPFEREI